MKTNCPDVFKKIFLVPFAFILHLTLGYAQNVSPYSLSPDWYFGQGGRLTFPSGSFSASGAPTTGSMPTNNSTGVEASTSVCFSNGSVALYTNTQQVYNADPANSGWWSYIRSLTTDNTCAGSSTGGGVAFPDPASPTNAFYLVLGNDLTSGSCAGAGVNRYRFTGTGTSVAYNAGPTLMAPTTFAGEAITAGTDTSGGYWVVIHNKTATNTFRVWHFTKTGITGPNDYTINPNVTDVSGTQSYLKISPCQNKIAYHSGATLVVNNWDRNTGTVGSEIRRMTLSSPYDVGVGLEFSPDGSKVYYSGQGNTVKYFDIGTGTTGTVTGSASWSMQLGPDGKIYTSPGGSTSTVGVISSPNSGPTYSTLSLPGGASIFRGLSNIAWLSPNRPAISKTTTNCDVNFSYNWTNYFNSSINVSSVSWDFGDGNSSTSANPSHTYASGGSPYTAVLTIVDAVCGQTWTQNINVPVSCTTPVIWLDIDAIYNSGKVNIIWSTAKEENNSHFILQRSSDGVNFNDIGVVSGSINSTTTKNYQYTDPYPLKGESYYRIVQVDLNGAQDISKVIPVNVSRVGIAVNPNPSAGNFEVLSLTKGARIFVTDVLGRVIYETVNDNNFNQLTFGAEFPKGAYVLNVISGEDVFTEKLIKE